MTDLVTVEARGAVAVVRLNRPPANAMNPELLTDLVAVLDELKAETPGAVVLTGRSGFFSSGVDLKLVPGMDAATQHEMVSLLNRMAIGWYGFPGPVVAAIDGHAIAGGLVLAMCADFRIAGPTGKLGLTELRAGVPYPVGALEVCRAELTKPVARRVVLGAELFDTAHALEWDVVDKLVPEGTVVDGAVEIAGELACTPPLTYAHVKNQLRGARVAELETAAATDPLLEGWLGSEAAAAAAALLG
jgi:enoyl-CoA hydratase